MLKLIRNEKGAALPMVVIIFMILMMLGIAFLRTSESDAQQTVWQNNRVQAHYLGRSGVNQGLLMLKAKLSSDEDPYTDTVQQLIEDLNNQVANSYTLDDTGTYTIHFDEGIYSRQVRITSVGNISGRLSAEKTVSYMVDLIPPHQFENPSIWISGRNFVHGTQPTNIDGTLNEKSLLGYAVLAQTNNIKNAVQSPQNPNAHSTFQASLIAFTDSQGESLEQTQNSTAIDFDTEIILFPGEVNLPPDSSSNPLILKVSDMVLQQRTENPLSGKPRAPLFLQFDNDDFDTEAQEEEGFVGFENTSRYEAFIQETGSNRSLESEFEEGVVYGVVRFGGGIRQGTGNNRPAILNIESLSNTKGYFYFPSGMDLTKEPRVNGNYGLNDLIPIPDDDPLVEILESISRLSVSGKAGLWNNR